MKTTTLKLTFQKLGANEVVIIRDFSSKKSLPSRAVKHYLAAWKEETLTKVRVYKVTSETDQKGIYCPCIWVSGADLAAELASTATKKSRTSSKPASKKPTTKKASKPSSKKAAKPTTKPTTKKSSQPSKKAEPKVTKLSELSSILGDKVVQSIDVVDGKLVITL